jgi:microcystin-dependent protein
MMKKWLPLILLLLLSSSAPGNVPCTLPFNIQNGQPADATQVMANYNALVNCLTRAAASNVNNDITALTALTSPISPAGGGTTVFIAGTSTGAANAQILATTTPTFVANLGYQVTFTAGFTNTGAMTLQVGSSAPLPIFRRTQLGISATVGGEVIAGQRVVVVYDGTRYQLQSDTVAIVGVVVDYTGTVAPAGWAFANGACVSRTQFADLFAVISTTYDPTGTTCSVVDFALPDARGRMLAGRDSLGTRITVAGSNCNGAVLGGAGCGAQSRAIAKTNLPSSGTFTGSASVSGGNVVGNVITTDSGSLDHNHSFTASISNQTNVAGPGGLTVGASTGSGTTSGSLVSGYDLTHSHNLNLSNATQVLTISGAAPATGSATVNIGGSDVALPLLNPTLIVNKIIKL